MWPALSMNAFAGGSLISHRVAQPHARSTTGNAPPPPPDGKFIYHQLHGGATISVKDASNKRVEWRATLLLWRERYDVALSWHWYVIANLLQILATCFGQLNVILGGSLRHTIPPPWARKSAQILKMLAFSVWSFSGRSIPARHAISSVARTFFKKCHKPNSSAKTPKPIKNCDLYKKALNWIYAAGFYNK